jgi:hypothetical protein
MFDDVLINEPERTMMGKLDRIIELLEQLITQTAPRVRKMREPSPDRQPTRSASVETWLDWREDERKRGNRVTLDTIAARSQYSISTIKKKSMARKVCGAATKSNSRDQ